MREGNISPFVKWAGGKRQLIEHINRRLPKEYNAYYEPFVGGGAVVFNLLPKTSYINDINKVLINAYEVIRNSTDELIVYLKNKDEEICTKEKYYEARNRFNEKILKEEYDVELAGLFIYINKRCFNGLYRVNSKGLFNVPFNNKEKTVSFSEENLREMSAFLKNVIITNEDFETAVKNAEKGDFVFFDSPYAPLNPASFEAYTKEGFDIENHKRLAKLFRKLDEKGCYLMLTNHNTDLINKLYEGYNIDVIDVKRMINSKGDKRRGQEVIVTNYKY